MKNKKSNLGLITSLFDLNNDGKLDVVEEALLISSMADISEEKAEKLKKETIQRNKTCRNAPAIDTVNLDKLDIKGI
ncbi:MAG: hypothetical protein ACI3XO_02685 [Eubacteriales bacterium]